MMMEMIKYEKAVEIQTEIAKLKEKLPKYEILLDSKKLYIEGIETEKHMVNDVLYMLMKDIKGAIVYLERMFEEM